jgi:hypothetical protein
VNRNVTLGPVGSAMSATLAWPQLESDRTRWPAIELAISAGRG